MHVYFKAHYFNAPFIIKVIPKAIGLKNVLFYQMSDRSLGPYHYGGFEGEDANGDLFPVHFNNQSQIPSNMLQINSGTPENYS